MSLFRRKPKEPETPKLRGWRIVTRRNEPLDKTIYRVILPGWYIQGIHKPDEYEDFDNYDDALAYYHEKASWSVVEEVQP